MANKFGKLTMEDFYYFRDEYIHLHEIFLEKIKKYDYREFKKEDNEVFGNPILKHMIDFVDRYYELDSNRYIEGSVSKNKMKELSKEHEMYEKMNKVSKPLEQKYIFIKEHIVENVFKSSSFLVPHGTIIKQDEQYNWIAYYPDENTKLDLGGITFGNGIIYETKLVEPY